MCQQPAKRTCRTITDSIAAMVLSRHRRGNEIGPIGEAPTLSGRQERVALANRLKAVGIRLTRHTNRRYPSCRSFAFQLFPAGNAKCLIRRHTTTSFDQ